MFLADPTKVPISDSVSMVKELLARDGHPLDSPDLIEKCVMSIYFPQTSVHFFFPTNFWNFNGFSFILFVAHIFMGTFEAVALESSLNKPRY